MNHSSHPADYRACGQCSDCRAWCFDILARVPRRVYAGEFFLRRCRQGEFVRASTKRSQEHLNPWYSCAQLSGPMHGCVFAYSNLCASCSSSSPSLLCPPSLPPSLPLHLNPVLFLLDQRAPAQAKDAVREARDSETFFLASLTGKDKRIR
jgi:hypothetical protein